MPISGTWAVDVGAVENSEVEDGDGSPASANVTIVSETLGRFLARLSGVTGKIAEVWLKPSAVDVPTAGFRIRVYDEDTADSIGRVFVDETDPTEGAIQVSRPINGTLVVMGEGMGNTKRVNVSVSIE